MRTTTLAFSLLLTSLTFACSGGDDDDTTVDPPGPPQPRNVDPIVGGGTSGGKIDGVLTVFVQDEADVLLEGATVVVVHGGETWSLKTDAEGRVDFNKDGLDSTLSLHIFMDGFEFTSAFGFDASVITIELGTGLDPTPADALVGTFTGTVTGWDQLSANSSTTARVAIVDAVGTDAVGAMQKPRPGTVTPGDPDGSAYNVAINGIDPFPMWTDYSLEADTRTELLIVSGGIFDLNAGTISFERIGVLDGVSVAEGMSTDANLSLSHPLDQTLSVTANSLPMLDNRAALFALSFGTTDKLFGLSSIEFPGTTESARAPALTGDFAIAKYTIGLQASSTEEVAGEPAQVSFAITTGDTQDVTFEKILAPPSAPSITGRTLETMPSADATLHIVEIRNSTGERSTWNIALVGNAATIELPAVPDGLVDPLTGTRVVSISAIDLGNFDVNDASFGDLDDSFVSTAETRIETTF